MKNTLAILLSEGSFDVLTGKQADRIKGGHGSNHGSHHQGSHHHHSHNHHSHHHNSHSSSSNANNSAHWTRVL